MLTRDRFGARAVLVVTSHRPASDGGPIGFIRLRTAQTALGYGIMVLTIEQDKIAEITGFADPTLFPVFDQATRIDW